MKKVRGVDMQRLIEELQRQPKFKHTLRPRSKLHPRQFGTRQLLVGAMHELEHTDDPVIAVEIAMDHIDERKDYYPRLHRAIPNPGGADRGDMTVPREWADELRAWGEFAPAAGSVGDLAAEGKKIDPVRVRLAVEELRELAKTMKDKRLAKMAHVLRGRLENRVFEHELGIAEDNEGGRKGPLRRAKGNPRVKLYAHELGKLDLSKLSGELRVGTSADEYVGRVAGPTSKDEIGFEAKNLGRLRIARGPMGLQLHSGRIAERITAIEYVENPRRRTEAECALRTGRRNATKKPAVIEAWIRSPSVLPASAAWQSLGKERYARDYGRALRGGGRLIGVARFDKKAKLWRGAVEIHQDGRVRTAGSAIGTSADELEEALDEIADREKGMGIRR